MAPEIASPAPSLNPTKFGIQPSLRPKIPSSDGLGEGCHGLRHNRSEEVEGRRDAAPAAMPRRATTRQRSDDSTDTDDREQLVYRRTRQPGTLHQNARLNEERAAGSVRLFILAAFRPFQFSHNLKPLSSRELRQHCGTSGVGNRDLVTTFPVKLKNIGAHIQTFRAKANTWIQCHFPVWSSDGHWSNDLYPSIRLHFEGIAWKST